MPVVPICLAPGCLPQTQKHKMVSSTWRFGTSHLLFSTSPCPHLHDSSEIQADPFGTHFHHQESSPWVWFQQWLQTAHLPEDTRSWHVQMHIIQTGSLHELVLKLQHQNSTMLVQVSATRYFQGLCIRQDKFLSKRWTQSLVNACWWILELIFQWKTDTKQHIQ